MANSPYPGGKSALFLFVLVLAASVVESQLTQYVQTTLKYRQPYFLIYVAHSSFSIVFPLHVLYLRLVTGRPVKHYLNSLSLAIKRHIAGNPTVSEDAKFPWLRFTTMVGLMTVGITLPGLLLFSAISLAPLTDVTAIWNASAFFAYVFTVKMFQLPWERKPLFAVLLAMVGVMAVIYGGTSIQEDESEQPEAFGTPSTATAPLLGDLLMLIGSVEFGLYQVLYKKYLTLPSGLEQEEPAQSSYAPIPRTSFDSISDGNPPTDDPTSGDSQSISDMTVHPLPFGLHPNLLTSLAGIFTILFLWIPLPFLHYVGGAEPFHWPTDWHVALVISGIALCSITSVGGTMILLGVWGPIVTSIGNLLTVVLIFVSDVMFVTGMKVVTFWNFMGAFAIVAAFGVLVGDLITGSRSHSNHPLPP